MKEFYITLPFIIFFMSSCQDKQTSSDLEELEMQILLETQNKEIAKRWLNEIDNENFGIIDELIAKDCKIYYAKDTLGQEWLRAAIIAFPQSFAESVHIINDLVAENDKVVVRMTVRAKQIGEFMGTLSMGKQVEYDAISVYQIEKGKITEMWLEDYAVLGLMVQLGMELQIVEEAE